jgi:hypothetical protein
MNRDNDQDRFGMPESAFQAARDAHRGIARMGMFVPTRGDVRTMEVDALATALEEWMHESPSELIPSYEQIREVIYELGRRTDRKTKKVADLMSACLSYLDTDNA